MPTDPAPTATTLFEGVYFDGRSSRDRAARLYVAGETVSLQVAPLVSGNVSEQRYFVRDLEIDPPMPGVRRVIKLPDGGRFETTDDAAVSALEVATGRNRALRSVRYFESRWSLTLGALALLGLFAWGFLTYGLPAVARSAAAATPMSVLESFDKQTIDLLDDGTLLGKSRLSAARQAKLKREFEEVVRWAGGDYQYRLLIRDGEPEDDEESVGGIGANAFALPGGTVVLTDQLVALSRSDKELMAVLAHEAGHVKHRHSLAGIYQALGLGLLTTAVTGDVVSASTYAMAFPTWLLQNGYSRQAETQSDEVAGRYMMETGGSTKPLRDILARLETEDKNADENSVKKDDFTTLFQTHPGTAQRIKHLREIEQRGR